MGLGGRGSALCISTGGTGRPLLIKGGNSCGPEFLGWDPRDLAPCEALFPLLKCPDWALGSKVWGRGADAGAKLV